MSPAYKAKTRRSVAFETDSVHTEYFHKFCNAFLQEKMSQNIGSVRKGRLCSCTILGFNGVGPSVLEIQVQKCGHAIKKYFTKIYLDSCTKIGLLYNVWLLHVFI